MITSNIRFGISLKEENMLKDSTFTLLTQGLMFVLSLLASVVIARALGPSLKGAYSIFVLTLSLASMLVTFGLGASVVYLGAQEVKRLPRLAGNGLAAALGTGLLGIIVVEAAILTPFFRHYLLENGLNTRLLQTGILILPVLQMQAYLVEILRAGGDIKRYNLARLARVVLNLGGVIVWVWAWPQGVTGAITAWLGAVLISAVLTVWWALQLCHYHLAWDRALFRQMLRFGLKLYPGNIMQFLNYRLDVFIVGFLLGPREVGLYVTATALAERLWDIPHALRTVLLQRVAASKEKESANQLTAQTVRVTLALVGMISLLLAFVAYPLIRLLYGLAFLPSAPLLIILLPGIVLLSVGKLLATHLSGQGRPEVGTYAAATALLATVSLDFLLIPPYGLTGAAIASAISYTISAIMLFSIFLYYSKMRAGEVLFIRQRDISLLLQRLAIFLNRRRSDHAL